MNFAVGAYFASTHKPTVLSPILAHVWVWYCELSDARTSSGFGVNPITFQDIFAWASLTRVCLEPWEVRLIRQVDNAILRELTKRADRDSQEIDVTDVDRVSSLFSTLRSRQQVEG